MGHVIGGRSTGNHKIQADRVEYGLDTLKTLLMPSPIEYLSHIYEQFT